MKIFCVRHWKYFWTSAPLRLWAHV